MTSPKKILNLISVFLSSAIKKLSRLKRQACESKAKLAETERTFRETYIDKVRGIITEKQFQELSRAFSAETEKRHEQVGILEREIVLFEKKEEEDETRKWIAAN